MTETTRRSFLAAGAAGAALAAARVRDARAQDPVAQPAGNKQNILVLGGTGFLGPHFVRAALSRGHSVTLFNRGRTNPQLFPELEKLHGDRDKGDLEALRGKKFDACIDTSGYVPDHVTATAQLLAESCKHYQFISSISVYPDFGEKAVDLDEDSAVGTIDDATAAKVSTIRASLPFYGPLKARCEQAAAAALPGRVCSLRPGLIVGPGDPTDRFTWWPVRMDRGGEVMCPGDADGPVQAIDVRDLAAFMVRCLEQGTTGVYNAVGFAGRVTMGDFLGACRCTTSSAVQLTWVSEAFLSDEKVGPWMEMPLWIPRGGRCYAHNERAVGKGLGFRPLADTIRDTLQWAKTERGDRPFEKTGVAAEKEAALLAKWRERGQSR